MRALVVDDERLARMELRRLLRAHPDVNVVGEATHVTDALAQIERTAPDLLLLDIEMPGGTGFDVLTQLDGSAPQVIFTTAYDQHALRAFEVNALDYLVKPVEPARLARALERVRAVLGTAGATTSTVASAPIERVFVRDGERCYFVELEQVLLLASVGNYAELRLRDRPDRPLLNRSLNYLEERLDPARFFRASRQHIINLSAIAAVDVGPGGTLVMVLTDRTEVEMSRRQSQRFRSRMAP